ncbi:hypothetical protein [Amnibacterium endophyticum]|uniref:Uncharacterized protein n=1 Tax=Amnibacterium endophyticum TaxID=2109337 RepID=A0ABW4LEL3_9MICO
MTERSHEEGAAPGAGELARRRRDLYRRDATPGAAAAYRRDLSDLQRSVEPDGTAADPTPAVLPASAPPSAAARPGRRLLLAAVVVAAVVGTALGLALPRPGAPASTAAALAVFGTAQREDDRPPRALLPPALLPDTTRLLGTSTTSGLRVYAARDRADRVCLLAIERELDTLSACTEPRGFAAGGLALRLQVDVDPVDDSPVVRPRWIEPTWSPDGAFAF